ncbi:nodulation protein NodH [Rhodobacteraceae bacterium (ex Bugula neritina AB1)]|nr:nodulation protein NodH [Rhodobacteraceae bacterium (ex Bugula neritina AB1)]
MSSSSFDYFTVFAEMRTGSNFLETNLNAFDGLTCHGEAFNPHFIGYPNSTEILGVTQAMREADPARLIQKIKEDPNSIGGFRYFHDHDPRVLDVMLEDPRCAKIILTRNPLDSYVSWKIAKETGQWKLTNVKRRKEAKAQFDAVEFAAHVGALQAFQTTLLNRLQALGQTAFYVAYEDLQSVDVMNGLARWLGATQQLEELDGSLKRQNPAPVLAKVANPDEMQEALAGLDRFNLTRTPNFEPRRGPAVPGYIAGADVPMLYLPLKGGPEAEVAQWMAGLDQAAPEALIQGMNQKQLRQWKRKNKGFRSFSVLRHPAARAHAVFCRRILNAGEGSYRQIRNTLRRQFGLPLPEAGPDDGYSRAQHREAFAGFLEFVRSSLAGQTSVRLDAEWATQSQALAGFAELGSPDLLIREDEMHEDLPALARKLGRLEPGAVPTADPETPFALEDVYDEELEALISSVYQRDYLTFGFGPWRKG